MDFFSKCKSVQYSCTYSGHLAGINVSDNLWLIENKQVGSLGMKTMHEIAPCALNNITCSAICVMFVFYYRLFYVSDIDECEFSPCYNGGTCFNSFGSFTCECPPGWQGPTCRNGRSSWKRNTKYNTTLNNVFY